MTKFLYASFTKNSFLISDGKSHFKGFKINNFEGYVPLIEHIDIYNKKSKQSESIITSKTPHKGNYKNIPYVPVYQGVYNNFDFNIKEFQRFMKEEFSISRLFKPTILVAIPDDSIEIDKRCILEFFIGSDCIKHNRIYLIPAGLMLSKTLETEHCCALIKSSRTIALSLVMNGGLICQMSYPHEYSDLTEIKVLLNSWANQFNITNLPVFLYGEDIELFSSLGIVVSNDVLLENLKLCSDSFKLLRHIKTENVRGY